MSGGALAVGRSSAGGRVRTMMHEAPSPPNPKRSSRTGHEKFVPHRSHSQRSEHSAAVLKAVLKFASQSRSYCTRPPACKSNNRSSQILRDCAPILLSLLHPWVHPVTGVNDSVNTSRVWCRFLCTTPTLTIRSPDTALPKFLVAAR